jgi:hypothetical protein
MYAPMGLDLRNVTEIKRWAHGLRLASCVVAWMIVMEYYGADCRKSRGQTLIAEKARAALESTLFVNNTTTST